MKNEDSAHGDNTLSLPQLESSDGANGQEQRLASKFLQEMTAVIEPHFQSLTKLSDKANGRK